MSPVLPIYWPETSEMSPHTHHRILLLSFAFPPSDVPGSRRAEGLFRWLPKFGWEPSVVTAAWGVNHRSILEIPHRNLLHHVFDKWHAKAPVVRQSRPKAQPSSSPPSTFTTVTDEIAHWCDSHLGWSARVAREAIAQHSKKRIDLVWATCAPFALAYTAQQIAAALRCPYVIDLQEPLPAYLTESTSTRHWLGQALAHAEIVTMAVPACATPVFTRFRQQSPPVCVLNSAPYHEAIQGQTTSQFTIVYPGQFQQQCDLQPFFTALGQLADALPEFRRDTRMLIIGPDSASAPLLPAYKRIADICELCETLPATELPNYLQQASLILVVASGNGRCAGMIPESFFTTLLCDIPILVMGNGQGLLDELLTWTGAGVQAESVDAITAFIREQYQRWKSAGVNPRPRDVEAVAFLSQRRMAGEFAEVFNAIGERRDILLRTALPWTDVDPSVGHKVLDYKPMSFEQ